MDFTSNRLRVVTGYLAMLAVAVGGYLFIRESGPILNLILGERGFADEREPSPEDARRA